MRIRKHIVAAHCKQCAADSFSAWPEDTLYAVWFNESNEQRRWAQTHVARNPTHLVVVTAEIRDTYTALRR